MIGVGQHHLCARFLELRGRDGFDIGEGPDGHEARGLNDAMRREKLPRARTRDRTLGQQFKLKILLGRHHSAFRPNLKPSLSLA